MKNKNKIRRNLGVLLVVWLLLAVFISSIVLAGVVTNTDVSTTTTDSDLIINYEEGWANLWNATIDNESVNDTVINQWSLGYEHRGDQFFNDSKAADISNDMMLGWNASNATMIRNSNGNYYPATGTDANGYDNIHAAYWELNSTGYGKVILPRGTITLLSDLALTNNTVFEGQGEQNTIIKLGADCSWGFKAVSGGGGDTVYRHNITFKNLKIDAETNASSCLYLTRCWDVNIENVWLNGSTSWNIYTEYYCGRFTVDGLKSTGMNRPTGNSFHCINFVNLQDSILENLYMFDSVDSADMIDLVSCKNLIVRNVHIPNCANDGFKIAGNSKNITVDGVYIDGVKDTAAGEDAFSFYTAGTVCDLNVDNLFSNEGSVYLQGIVGCNFNNAFITNTLDDGSADVKGHGLVIYQSSHIRGNLVVVNDTEKSGLYIYNSDDVTFTNSEFSYNDNSNKLLDSSHVKFVACDFKYNTGDGIATNEGTTCNNITVMGSTFYNNTDTGIDMGNNDHWWMLMGNTFYDDTVDQNCDDIIPADGSLGDFNLGYVKV